MIDFFFFLLKIFSFIIIHLGIIFCFGFVIPFASVDFVENLLEKIKNILNIIDGFEVRKLSYVFSYLGTITCCYITFSSESEFYFDFLLVFVGAFISSILGIIIDNIIYSIKYKNVLKK